MYINPSSKIIQRVSKINKNHDNAFETLIFASKEKAPDMNEKWKPKLI